MHYLRIVSSIPSLLLSKSALYHAEKAVAVSPVSSSTVYTAKGDQNSAALLPLSFKLQEYGVSCKAIVSKIIDSLFREVGRKFMPDIG